MPTLDEQFDNLALLADNWNGEGSPAPTPEAIDKAKRVLSTLLAVDLVPVSVEPDAEGGAVLCFEADDTETGRSATIAFMNTGNAFVVLLPGDKRVQRFDILSLAELTEHLEGA